ncbi:hypothetical protein CARUB_v10021372mg [Capsella rubella]|uniref:Transmembrane protein n=1 Tax=Capsella rubella TaxID=81985 RepID=R0I737_9BRAS|nr:uncharacterized protein LOC17894636 [Capsella rubella]EOA33880.1 hypothetical protein CARUB_v10021372mg [Capsella rubella]
MGSKKPSYTFALLISLLILIIFTISSQVRVVEATSRILANGRPIIWTPASKSCGALHASWKKYRRPCKRPKRTPRTAPASYNSP